jgi:dethiobiotin synthetase
LSARLIVVSGTGTDIGKTHLSEALLRAMALLRPRVIGLKPIETGLGGAMASDTERLERASTFHVQHFGYLFADPVSPHLAARNDGTTIDTDALADHVRAVRRQADVVLVELAGGLFTPLSDELVNADLARDLAPDVMLLVAPDRLGVLHDVLAAVRAAATVPLPIDAVVLVTPAAPDASAGRNADELARLLDVAMVGTLPRASQHGLSSDPTIQALAARVTR